MKQFSILSVILLFFINLVRVDAQEDITILTIGDYSYPAGEFWHVYKKNQHLPGFNETPEVFSIRFINYKLKVVEAISQGLDTIPAFLREFEKYADDLKSSFLIDSLALEKTARDAHRNMQNVVNASHILVLFQPDASPADTLKAWNKINDIRKNVIDGEDFNELAATYSEDPSAVQNGGKLGYFSAFRMVLPFEKAAFETPVGEVSAPVRTEFGYHLIYVSERMPNPGTIRVAHIMKIFPRDASPEVEAAAKSTIDSIYTVLLGGTDFAQLAQKHSDDGNSSGNGGEMRPFSLQEMVPEFAFAAFDLKHDGEVSAPVRTDFGWHIIKRLELTPIASYESQRSHIINMMGRDGRDKAGQEAFLKQKKTGQGFELNMQLLEPVFELMADDSISNEDFFQRVKSSDAVLYKYEDKAITLNEFIDVLKGTPTFHARQGSRAIERILDRKVTATILEVEKRNLAKNNPDYRYLVNEYFDGLLIFDLSNQEIWQKVGKDTLALMQHYLDNPLEFTEPPYLEGVMCEVKTKRLIRRVNKQIKSSGVNNLVQILKDNAKSESCYVCVEDRLPFLKDASNPVSVAVLPNSNPLKNSTAVIYWQGTVGESHLKPFDEIRGQVMSSYQNRLEEEWVDALRSKHQPVFNFDLLKKSKR